MKKLAIICVDDELTVLESLEIELYKALGDDYPIETASDGEEALELLAELRAQQLCCGSRHCRLYHARDKGDELLIQMHRRSPQARKIMLTGQAEMEGM